METQPQIATLSPPSPLQEKVAEIRDVSSLPHVVLEIIDVANSPDSTASDLQRAVEMDPSLTARLLQAVNSAAYQTRAEIRSVHHAIAFLGFSAVRNIALASTVADIFRDDQMVGSYTRQGLWRHLVSVAVTARMIAARAGVPDFEDAFLAGLLHDFGIILLDQYCHDDFMQTIEALPSAGNLCHAEMQCLGYTHAEMAGAVASKWKMPSSVLSSMLYHHNAQDCTDENRSIVQVVELANFLCASKGIPSIAGAEVGLPAQETLNDLAITREDYRVLWEDLDGELNKAEVLSRI